MDHHTHETRAALIVAFMRHLDPDNTTHPHSAETYMEAERLADVALTALADQDEDLDAAIQAAADEWTAAARRSRSGAVRQMVADPYPGTFERLWQLWREHRAAKKAGTS
jgi:hypothetical protein